MAALGTGRRGQAAWPPSRGASPAGVADLYVDVDALAQLARQLGAVRAALARAERSLGADRARLGSARIGAALDDFVSGWRDGRRQLIEGIDGLAARVAGAIEAYREQEAALSAAAGGGGP